MRNCQWIAIQMLVGVVVSILAIGNACGQCDFREKRRLRAEDARTGAYFGQSVVIVGDLCLIGAPAAEQNGAAYLFNIASGEQIVQIIPDAGGQRGADFGVSLAASGEIAVVGASWDLTRGAAYSFNLSDPNAPVQLARMIARDVEGADYFGVSVDIEGSLVVVGAHQNDDFGSNSGSAYLFDAETGFEYSKILPNDPAALDYFGESVAIASGVVIVGSHGDDDNGERSGSAYLFDVSDPANPRQVSKLLPNDGSTGAGFGEAVALHGSLAAISASGDVGFGGGGGAVYLFDISDVSNPIQIAKMAPSDGARYDTFGWRLAMTADLLVVPSPRDDDLGDHSGSVYVFDISDPSNPRETAKLKATDGGPGDALGYSVAVADHTIVAGAALDNLGGRDAGTAYVFDTDCGPELEISGPCPGLMLIQIRDASPGGAVFVLGDRSVGHVHVPARFPCPGTSISLTPRAVVVARRNADTEGRIDLNVTVGGPLCGQAYLQALDLSGCRASNAIQVE